MTAAAGEHDTADCRSAYQARLTFAAINSMLELEESFFSIRVHVIVNRRSAQRDRLAEHFPHRSVQLAQLLAREARRPPAGTDASPKQRLVSVNVADAAQQLLI